MEKNQQNSQEKIKLMFICRNYRTVSNVKNKNHQAASSKKQYQKMT